MVLLRVKKIPNLSNCSEYGKEIISHPLKAFTTLSCGHTFHRLCIEKKLLLTIPNICPFSGCSEEVEIIEMEGRRGSESSTSSVVRRMEKHSIQDMPEIQEEDMPDVNDDGDKDNHPSDKSTTPSGEESRKRPSKNTPKNKSPSKKAKKEVKREDSPILKKLIQELTSPTHQQVEGPITLQSSVSEMDIGLLDFLDLYNKINTAEDNLQRTTHDLIRCYYNLAKPLSSCSIILKKTCNEDVSNARVNDRIRDQISVQDKLTETNLRKRKERDKKVFRLFSNVGGKEAIERIKSFNATTILNLPPGDVDFVIARLNE
ncbi:hypothetical protein F8M41_006131 [Gigaspora margarita]|uniref:RING-type domain-containing protein n=1 Tax=Gigaspora margarita TaxID=4874 RepID=A0A8H4B4L0_GIGMA|nr:hypothetical protein F8M41_006131 [Gigaspora margarita]